ncbi:H-type lectin domain-containing protein [Actibacterium lipolyticum]|uniref:H-type lectin domain protein n=1 Tax=Actibacterium lipolyticum TaxID=1524263 RepID=A0A238JLV5_9RHOB|nr:H-type lectin domain-containing protein [Actibacterium lipolyticum]SMX31649.1 H-type lectin domain protein [Actibacterium lipolyticum]
MKEFDNRKIGVDQGSTILFSDYENDGPMWAEVGPRSTSVKITFDRPFRSAPAVTVGMSMWDMDQKTNLRADISTQKINRKGFEIVFKTWGDTRVARVRADWMAIGELPFDDDWDVS